ncbi:MAG: DNA repair protein RecN [Eubacteriales bacterium]|nr:DNA repair protein RecN [Eubacteriales bacterium]
MLVSMTVRNIALIERLEVQFHKGLHVLTGETGAGKSIVVDAINLMLGERADRGLIRTGCDKATVEAIFDLSDAPQVKALLQAELLEAEGNLMPVMREISLSDRNICRVCGVIVPLTLLKQISGYLVDIHGQHEHQSLLDPKNHLGFLDAFGDGEHRGFMAAAAETCRRWREASAVFSALRKENAKREERMELLSTRLKELEAARPTVGEEAELIRQRARLADAEKISGAIEAAYDALTAAEGERPSVTVLLKEAREEMTRIAEYDPRFAALSERLSSAFYEAEEMGIELRDLAEGENFDPDKNERILARLDTYRRLEKRYGMEADELADYAERLRDDMNAFASMDDRLQKAEVEFKARLAEYRTAAGELTQSRAILARRFETLMESQLSELGMGSTRFSCTFTQPAPGQKQVPSTHGDDHVEFFIAPNVGEPLKPLVKTASGGELSRIMLALKAAAADHAMIPTMIFDEIDTGISGRVAGVVAEKMDDIARFHQVICVTHLAQIAAMADVQYRVEKNVQGDRTLTTVAELSPGERVEEIARLVGVGEQHYESGVVHARNLLAAAWERKQGHRG